MKNIEEKQEINLEENFNLFTSENLQTKINPILSVKETAEQSLGIIKQLNEKEQSNFDWSPNDKRLQFVGLAAVSAATFFAGYLLGKKRRPLN